MRPNCEKALISACVHPAQVTAQLQRSVGALSTSAMSRMETDLALVRRPQRRGSVLGRAGRPGRHQGFRDLVPRVRRPRAHRRARRRSLRRGPAGAHRSDQPPADRRSGPAEHRGRRGKHRHLRPSPRTPPGSMPRSCATPARSPSRPPRSHARAAEVRGAWDARLAALVVDSVPAFGDRRDRAVPGQGAGLGGPRARGPSCWVPSRRSAAPATSSTTYAVRHAWRAWTRSVRPKVTASWRSSAA